MLFSSSDSVLVLSFYSHPRSLFSSSVLILCSWLVSGCSSPPASPYSSWPWAARARHSHPASACSVRCRRVSTRHFRPFSISTRQCSTRACVRLRAAPMRAPAHARRRKRPVSPLSCVCLPTTKAKLFPMEFFQMRTLPNETLPS